MLWFIKFFAFISFSSVDMNAAMKTHGYTYATPNNW